jgi:hypothetical protein
MRMLIVDVGAVAKLIHLQLQRVLGLQAQKRVSANAQGMSRRNELFCV